ncbi:plexin-B1 [Alosa pseudoharengus]|uniref:plexin-B1 n=1 Tax=Alosa pseudoharengus TaxID=34774 RepID=UPI003F897736
MALACVLLQLLLLGASGVQPEPRYPRFSSNDTVFEHLALHPDPSVGTVYVGARDRLFQLDGLDGLRLEQEERTGPVRDSKDCLPPVTEAHCPHANYASNHNKLLLVDPYSMQLITCGSVHQGTCQKRSLDAVGRVLFSAERPVDTQHVAANDPSVSTVGLVVRPRAEAPPVLYVGRGYTSSQPPISTRHLTTEPIFSYEETAKLTVAGRQSEYDHHFVTTFSRRGHVYFLFYRRDLKAASREYRTFAARVCLDDAAYYSYVEVPLSCHSVTTGKNYNLLQAAHLGSPSSGNELLVGVFSPWVSSAVGPGDESALCFYQLDQLDRQMDATRDLCYTQTGFEGGVEVAYIEYDVKSNCANLPTNTLKAYPCGSDHTPSPMASRTAVESRALWDSPTARLTAVAASVGDQHTIAFLGDSKGNLHKVFIDYATGQAERYATISVQSDSPINSDLILDKEHKHLLIMTSNAVEKRPVSECERHADCESCLASHDPYCGWCVLEGRCGVRSSCQRGSLVGQWLWSFSPQQQSCLRVASISPLNASRGEETNVVLEVPGLPSLSEEEAYRCVFKDTETPASVQGTTVTCHSPGARRVPSISQGEDSVTVPLSLRFLNITVASHMFTFYDCGLVQQLSPTKPCTGCVSSRWSCNWCIHQHLCTHKPTCSEGVIIYNEHFKLPTSGPTTTKAVNRLASTTQSPTNPTTGVHSATESGASNTASVTPSTTPEPTLVPTTPPPTAATTALLPPMLHQATTVASTPTATTPLAGTHRTESGHAAADQSLSNNSTRVEEVLWTQGSQNDSLQDVGEEEETTDSSLEESVLDAGTTPVTSVVELPLDEDMIPPSPVPEAALTTPPPVESDEEAGAEVYVSSATVPSGDGEGESSPPDFSQSPDMDYQSDSADFYLPGDEGSFVSGGSYACPCVESIQGSSLLPVNMDRKITLTGRNLHLYKDDELDYECVLTIEGQAVVVDAFVEADEAQSSLFFITCQLHKYSYSAVVEEYSALVSVRRRNAFHMDTVQDLHVTLYNCSVGRSDCSRCHTADQKYGCVWCGGALSSCLFGDSCADEVQQTCPAPVIHLIEPLSGPIEGGTTVTISGSNLGQKAEDIQHSVTLAGVPCNVIPSSYEVSSRIVCQTTASGGERSGQASVEVKDGGVGLSKQRFHFQDPTLTDVFPQRGPLAGGTLLTITGQSLRTGNLRDIAVLIGGVPCAISSVQDDHIECVTGSSNRTGEYSVVVRFNRAERHLQAVPFHYCPDPNVTQAAPSRSFLSGGRMIRVSGHNLDVVQEPRIRVTLTPLTPLTPHAQKKKKRKRKSERAEERESRPLKRLRRIVPEPGCPEGVLCTVKQFEERCAVNSSSLILCGTPAVGPEALHAQVKVDFLLDNVLFSFGAVSGGDTFSYEQNPVLRPLNQHDPSKPYRHKPGSIISVEGENLDLAIFKEEVVAVIGEGVCAVKTLTRNHLYCEPPSQQPSVVALNRREGADVLPEFTVRMGNLNFSLGRVQYDTQSQSTFPLEAQVGVGVGASIVALIVLIIVLIYRRKSKQALRDYKKVQIQLENLETSVRDRCKKEFTDLMTEMMDIDLVGSGTPILDYRTYAERIFFPGHKESPLRRDLDVQECRRATVEQGLVQLSNLLNSKLFLTKFIHTLEGQRTFSPRDRAYVASLLTVALHGKLEYFTDILKTLLNDLVEQYTAKNPKLMLRRTESVVEKLLTNWMSICLYSFLRDSAGEPLYMMFRAIKHQVDKGPVDAVTGKAKYTLNDNRLLREDVEYRTLTLNVLVTGGGANETQTMPTKVLDCDTITQVKEKVLEQTWKGMSYSLRPPTDSLHLEWRAGTAGHLILSDEDLTSVVQGTWKRLNTLQHYKVPDGATVTLVPRHSKHIHHDSHDYMPGEKTPMLDDGDEGGMRLWHLVKASEEPELPKHRRASLRERERERAKAIPEIYLTRLLSMKGTLQKFVDDLFQVILSTSRPVPLAVKYFFDLLDEQALQHNITDPETVHIWKTNSLPLRFWVNILKNPHFIFDVHTSDNVDAVLSVIAQTFMDSCTIADHKLGRDSPINKLLYARDIPRYKQMVERYYADIRQTISASDQEMNSALAELSRNYSGEVNCLVALHELYKYINKYYDQIISALEEDPTAQKMQLGYRLQQIAAAVENKVTDL